MSTFEKKRVLIVVRTYPTPAQKGVEVSCTAAITEDGTRFVRLFPVPYRFLSPDKRFRKYQWIEVETTPANDGRPDSLKIRGDSIQILSDEIPTAHEWRARKDYVFPLRSPSLCHLKRQRETNGHPTLGLFRPRQIKRLTIQPTEASWTESQLAILRQRDLFSQDGVAELEKVPFKFKYEFECDDPDCNGHALSCSDWEMGAAWRNWKTRYGDQVWEQKFRERFESEMIHKYDTHFFVGTVHKHPAEWIIVGLFYPPKTDQPELF
jgi:hypothetical protein